MLFGRAFDVGFRHVMRKAFFPRHAAPAVHVDAMGIGYTEQSLQCPHDAGDALRSRVRQVKTRRAGNVSAARESITRMGSFRPQTSTHGEFTVACARTHGRQRQVEWLARRLPHALAASAGRGVCRIRPFPLEMRARAPALPRSGMRGTRRRVDQANPHRAIRFGAPEETIRPEGSRRKRDEHKCRHMHDEHRHQGRHAPDASTKPDIIGIHSGASLSIYPSIRLLREPRSSNRQAGRHGPSMPHVNVG